MRSLAQAAAEAPAEVPKEEKTAFDVKLESYDAANKIKAFFLDRFGPSSTSSGSGSDSGSDDDDDDDDDDVAAPAPAGGRASARLPFRCHRRGAAVRLPSSSEDSG